MQDAPLVGRVERSGNLTRDPQRIVCRHRAPQLVTMHVLEHQIARADVVKLADVRVVQRGDRPRFLLETAQSIGIAGKPLGKNLDRDVSP